MFDPVPSFGKLKYSEEKERELLLFKNGVIETCAKYNVDCTNRFTIIWDCCDLLEHEIDNNEGKIWKETKTYGIEPIEKVQDLMQLLSYTVGDTGLLFDDTGKVLEIPDFDNWQSTEKSYKSFGNAIHMRYVSMLELFRIHKKLHTHIYNKVRFEITGDKENKISNAIETILENLIKEGICNEKQMSNIKSGFNRIGDEHLLKLVIPLYIFLALTCYPDKEFSLEKFYKSIKRNKSKLKKDKNSIYSNYRMMDAILNAASEVGLYEENYFYFSPYYILEILKNNHNIQISDYDMEKLLNICYASFIDPNMEKELMKFEYKISKFKIGEILNDFRIVFEAQACDFTNDIKTKGVFRALRQLYSKEFIDDILYCKEEKEGFIEQMLNMTLCKEDFHNRYASIPYGKDNYSPKEYNIIKNKLIEEYAPDCWGLSTEFFWLLTGYIPPIGFNSDLSKPYKTPGLYKLFDFHLKNIWNQIFVSINKCLSEYNSLDFPIDVALDISKVNQVILIKDGKNLEMCKQIYKLIGLKEMETSEKEFFDIIKEHCLTQYYSVNKYDNKTNFKSFNYAKDIIEDEIVRQYVEIAGIQMYSKVFSTIVKFSDSLWLVPDVDKF